MPDYQLFHGDCLDVMRGMGAGTVDAVVTDPPYGIGGSSGTINKKRGKGNYNPDFEDTPDYIMSVVLEALKHCRRIARAVILTPGNTNMSLYPQPDSFGCFYQPASVGVQTFGNCDAQPIFYYGKNATRKNLGKKCSFKMTSRRDESIHPCRKPTLEWTRLILEHTLPGQTILDPFMGSGTTGEIAIKNGRNFIGIELSHAYFLEAQERIANAAGDFTLTAREKATGQMSIFDIQDKE